MSTDNIDISHDLQTIVKRAEDKYKTREQLRQEEKLRLEKNKTDEQNARILAREKEAKEITLRNRLLLKETIDNLISASNNHGDDNNKIHNMIKIASDAITQMQKTTRIDMKLVSHLEGLDKEMKNTIYSDKFPTQMSSIDDDSTIIYLKNAEIYKVYSPESCHELSNHLIADFKVQPIYEVVRDNRPQKLIIVIDDTNYERMKIIEKYLSEFIKEHKCAICPDNDPHIEILENKDKTEFVVTNVIFNNLHEKIDFTEDFILYMSSKEKEISEKIQLYPEQSGIKGIKYYDVPTRKINMKNGRLNDNLDMLVSKYPSSNIVVNLTVNNTIIDNSINNSTITKSTINSNISKIKASNGAPTKKELNAFYKNIYESKPSWYIENEYIELSTIESAYKKFFPNKQYTIAHISKQLKDMFIKSKRLNGSTVKMLIPMNDLKKIYDSKK